MLVLYSFGLNQDGQCGRPNKKDQKGILYPTPIRFPSGIQIVSVGAGSRHTLAVSSCGGVFSWGYGRQGQLGHGHTENLTRPERIMSLDGKLITLASAGGMHSGCVDSNNNLYTWGSSTYGQLGLGKNVPDAVTEPVLVLGIDDDVYPARQFELKINKLSCGGLHTAAIDLEGNLYCWGKADAGQIGYSKFYLDFDLGVALPKKIEGFEGRAVEVSCGGFYTLILNDCGRVYAMGKEDFGVLGVKAGKKNMNIGAEVPTLVSSLKDINIVAIRAGGWHSAFLSDDGQLFTCGKGEYGRLGVGSEKSMVEPTLVNCLQLTSPFPSFNLGRGIAFPPAPPCAVPSPGGSPRLARKTFSEEEDVNYVHNAYNISHVSLGGAHTVWATNKGQIYSVGRVDGGRLGLSADNEFFKKDRTILPNNITHNFYKMDTARVVRVSAGGSHTTVLVEYPFVQAADQEKFLEEIERHCADKL